MSYHDKGRTLVLVSLKELHDNKLRRVGKKSLQVHQQMHVFTYVTPQQRNRLRLKRKGKGVVSGVYSRDKEGKVHRVLAYPYHHTGGEAGDEGVEGILEIAQGKKRLVEIRTLLEREMSTSRAEGLIREARELEADVTRLEETIRSKMAAQNRKYWAKQENLMAAENSQMSSRENTSEGYSSANANLVREREDKGGARSHGYVRDKETYDKMRADDLKEEREEKADYKKRQEDAYNKMKAEYFPPRGIKRKER